VADMQALRTRQARPGCEFNQKRCEFKIFLIEMDFGILPMVPTWVLVHPRGMGPILGRHFFFPKLSDIENLSNFQKIKNLVNLHLKNQKNSRKFSIFGFKK
jgi:hypothetical protein